jgi:curli biogenesis system outer membrane secretion channel CsgG
MLKSTTAVMIAAAIAAAFTLLSAPAPVDAGPLAQPAETALKACTQRAWPYLNCVGTEFGNPRIRLVTVERLAQ